MSTWPVAATANRLLLSMVWPIPASERTAEKILSPERGMVEALDPEVDKDWFVARQFLARSETTQRYRFTRPLEVRIGDRAIPCALHVGWHEGFGAMTILVSVTIEGADGVLGEHDVDRAIAVVQSLLGRPSTSAEGNADSIVTGSYDGTAHDSVRGAVEQAFDDLVEQVAPQAWLESRGWCFELRSHDGAEPAHLVADDPRPFYGLAHADEGWRHVPATVASTSLGPAWGTRGFVAVHPVSSGMVCINTKPSGYVDHQDVLSRRYFGQVEPYFGLDAGIAGLDHGSLFVMERALIRMTLARRWLYQARDAVDGGSGESAGADERRLLRGSLDDVLEMLGSVLPLEVDDLERVVITRMGVERLVAQLDRQAEAMDEDTRYAYEIAVNRRVSRLTTITLVLTVVTIMVGFIQLVASF